MPDENLIPPERSILNPPPQLKPQERYFVEHFMVVGNLEEIPPIWSSYPAELCQELWERPHVRAEITARLEQQEAANAKAKAQLRAKAKLLAPEFIDAHAVDNVIESEPGSDKAKALEFAERRLKSAAESTAEVPANKSELLSRAIRLADTPPSKTNNNIGGQVSALQLVGKMQGWLIERFQDVTQEAKGKTTEELEFFCSHGYWPKLESSKSGPSRDETEGSGDAGKP